MLVAGGRDGEAAGCPPASGGETVVGQGRRLVSAVVEGRSSGRGRWGTMACWVEVNGGVGSVWVRNTDG